MLILVLLWENKGIEIICYDFGMSLGIHVL